MQLINVYRQTRVFSDQRAYWALSVIHLHNLYKKHCCYFLLALLGEAMPPNNEDAEDAEDAEDDLEHGLPQLLANGNVHKVVYVGVTVGESFRRAHLTDRTSPIHAILHANARLFLLRRYVTNSRVAAEQNEGYIIVSFSFFMTDLWLTYKSCRKYQIYNMTHKVKYDDMYFY